MPHTCTQTRRCLIVSAIGGLVGRLKAVKSNTLYSVRRSSCACRIHSYSRARDKSPRYLVEEAEEVLVRTVPINSLFFVLGTFSVAVVGVGVFHPVFKSFWLRDEIPIKFTES